MIPADYLKHRLVRASRKASRFLRRQEGSRRPNPPKGMRGRLISRDPFVFQGWGFPNLRNFDHVVGGSSAYFILMTKWDIEAKDTVKKAKILHDSHIYHNPEHEVIFLCDTKRGRDMLRNAGVPADWCNSNALVDERIFYPIPEKPVRFNAIYDAQLAEYKRHHLARKVDSLALIGGIGPSRRTSPYPSRVRDTLGYAHWYNDPLSEDATTLTPHEVCQAYNECLVGLCLSRVEGSMYASIQYLLCGLPVVSTPSRGGRDVFFDNEFVKIVRPTARAVRDGVKEMANRDIDPWYIRQRTLERMYEHRETYIRIVQDILDREQTGRDFRKEWPNVFVNKMLQWYDFDQLAETCRNG